MDKEYFESFDSHIICKSVRVYSMKFKRVDIIKIESSVLFISDDYYAREIESMLNKLFDMDCDPTVGLYSKPFGFIIVLPNWFSVKISYKGNYMEEGTLIIKETMEEGYTSEPEC